MDISDEMRLNRREEGLGAEKDPVEGLNRILLFKQEAAYEMLRSLVGSEMYIGDRVLMYVVVILLSLR